MGNANARALQGKALLVVDEQPDGHRQACAATCARLVGCLPCTSWLNMEANYGRQTKQPF